MITRRALLASCAVPLFGATAPKLRIGITDWNLKLGANPDAVPLAARLGFDGVQLSFGRKITDGKLPVDDSALIARYRALSAQHHIPIDGTCVDMLHTDGLKNGGQAIRWVSDSIRMTRALGSQVLLLPFFGRQATRTRQEIDRTSDILRELAPEAEKAGVILGLENENTAEENARMIDRSRSAAVRVYYDVGNSTNIGGYDVVQEIRWLGNDRICQIHLKDRPLFMGQGKIQFIPVMRAIRDIGFTGYANLETDFRPGSLDEDMRTNLAYIRDIDSKL
ncbi:MAG TPA: sugar phosphate isomerase/epimerase family protein [Bryobacteraceae bacterium]|nr:sugar phosphate isomerase/epimerase family protein [Bryobacteraceae bacterium]